MRGVLLLRDHLSSLNYLHDPMSGVGRSDENWTYAIRMLATIAQATSFKTVVVTVAIVNGWTGFDCPRLYARQPHGFARAYISEGTQLPEHYRNGAFIGQHGSWNRKPVSGYKVIFVPFAEGRPSGKPLDVLTGFLSDNEEALGRPVGVAMDRASALLVANDVGNQVWRVASAGQGAASAK